jgi:arginyl-tRNA synthetase
MTANPIDSADDPLYDFEQDIRAFLKAAGVPDDRIVLSVPPEPRFGEASSNAALLLAKERRRPPREIASEIIQRFDASDTRFIARAETAGQGFINFFLNYQTFVPHAIHAIERSAGDFGRLRTSRPQRLLVEHTSVNPNKEWHVGHLRNAVIGDTLVRLSTLAGHSVEVQNYIDDTGRQAAEAVFALQVYDPPPPSHDEKFDQYVGRYYVRLNAELAEPASSLRTEELQRGVERVLHEMDHGSHRPLVEKVVRAQLETAARIGAGYDLLVWESDIVRAHLLDEALGLLKQSPRVFVPEEGAYKGALVIELKPSNKSQTDEAEGQQGLYRVLVRSNGLPTYTGKDIPYMMWKFGLLHTRLDRCQFPSPVGAIETTCPAGKPFQPSPADQVFNVVAEHQGLQQQTVIEGLAAAGYVEEAQRAHHLSYGMVSQAEGRISGRKGSGVSADEVLDQAVAVARERISEKRGDLADKERDAIAEAIAVGSVRYLMCQYSPVKPIVFDLRDVVSFEGNTGLYVQYALVRMAAVLRRALTDHAIGDDEIQGGDPSLLEHKAERSLLIKLARFPSTVDDAFRLLGVNLIADYAHTLAAEFSQFYRDCPVLPAEPELRLARLRVVRAAQTVLTNAAKVLGIPVVERM